MVCKKASEMKKKLNLRPVFICLFVLFLTLLFPITTGKIVGVLFVLILLVLVISDTILILYLGGKHG